MVWHKFDTETFKQNIQFFWRVTKLLWKYSKIKRVAVQREECHFSCTVPLISITVHVLHKEASITMARLAHTQKTVRSFLRTVLTYAILTDCLPLSSTSGTPRDPDVWTKSCVQPANSWFAQVTNVCAPSSAADKCSRCWDRLTSPALQTGQAALQARSVHLLACCSNLLLISVL